MNPEQYNKKYWQIVDKATAKTLGAMRSYKIGDKIQDILDHYANLELNGMLPDREVDRLHRKISKWQGGRANVRPLKQSLSEYKKKKRIKAADALELELKVAYYEYYLYMDEINQNDSRDMAGKIYALAVTGTPDKPKKYTRDNLLDFLMDWEAAYGESYYSELYTDAAYRSLQIRRTAVMAHNGGRPLNVKKKEFAAIIRAGQRWLLYKTSKETYAGFFDSAHAYIATRATVEAARDAGETELIFIATVDERTTDVCLHLHRQIIPIDKIVVGFNAPPVRPPKHPCRSILRRVTPFYFAA